jgi:hypothetical protein
MRHQIPYRKVLGKRIPSGMVLLVPSVVLESDLLLIELAGTLAVELEAGRANEVHLFVFVNGTRLRDYSQNRRTVAKYLWRRGSEPFRWENLDEGYDGLISVNAKCLLGDQAIRD